MNVNPNNLCQIEIAIHEKDVTLNFYQKVLGWEISPADIHNCYIIAVPEDCPFGISLVYSEKNTKSQSNTRFYFKVSDLDSYQQKLEDFYQKKIVNKKYQSYGSVLHISDPCGNKLGLFQESENHDFKRL